MEIRRANAKIWYITNYWVDYEILKKILKKEEIITKSVPLMNKVQERPLKYNL